jgi:hypothetical protein
MGYVLPFGQMSFWGATVIINLLSAFLSFSNLASQGISFLGFHQRLVFWNSIHQEVASGPFCLLVNSPWPLVFVLCVFFFFLSAFNLYCWNFSNLWVTSKKL